MSNDFRNLKRALREKIIDFLQTPDRPNPLNLNCWQNQPTCYSHNSRHPRKRPFWLFEYYLNSNVSTYMKLYAETYIILAITPPLSCFDVKIYILSQLTYLRCLLLLLCYRCRL